ncbi:hypothetical protein JCM10213_006167 [Rhodosporidiobolus nylandii]
MELSIAAGVPLKAFSRALNTLLKLAGSPSADLDFTCTPSRLSLSVVNPSRTAFGVAHFYERFFQSYEVLDDGGGGGGGRAFKFAVTGKALTAALRSRSSTTVESVSITVGAEDPGAVLADDRSERSGDNSEAGHAVFVGGSAECRVVVKVFCQHGVVKTHRLTYSNANVNNWAKFDRDACTSSWVASGRVLRDWLEHFHLRTGAPGGGGGSSSKDSGASLSGSDELTFYCSPYECRLRSFNEAAAAAGAGGFEASDPLTSRPLATELVVDVEDFDKWEINAREEEAEAEGSQAMETVTFGLREFKAIISLCDSSGSTSTRDASSLPLSAHFTTGGRPLLLSLSSGPSSDAAWEARFVIATTDYDSGGGGSSASSSAARAKEREREESVKRESERPGSVNVNRAGSVAASQVGGNGAQAGPGPATTASRAAAAAAATTNGRKPLFNAPTPSPAPQARPTPAREPWEDDDDDEYGGGFDGGGEGMFEDPDAAFAEIDMLSQAATQAASQRNAGGGGGGSGGKGKGKEQEKEGPKELVRDTSEAGPSTSAAAAAAGGASGQGEEEEEEDEEEGEPDTEDEDDGGGGGGKENEQPQPTGRTTQMGPTQFGPTQLPEDEGGEGEAEERAVKRPRWNLLGD